VFDTQDSVVISISFYCPYRPVSPHDILRCFSMSLPKFKFSLYYFLSLCKFYIISTSFKSCVPQTFSFTHHYHGVPIFCLNAVFQTTMLFPNTLAPAALLWRTFRPYWTPTFDAASDQPSNSNRPPSSAVCSQFQAHCDTIGTKFQNLYFSDVCYVLHSVCYVK